MNKFFGAWKALALASAAIGAAALQFVDGSAPKTAEILAPYAAPPASADPGETVHAADLRGGAAASAVSATAIAAAAATNVPGDDDGNPTLQSDPQSVDDCTSSNPTPTPGDPVAGLWGDATRPDTGWTFSNIWPEGQAGERTMQVVWHTFYPQIGGSWTWLISDPSPPRKQPDGKWYWESTLKQTKLGDAGGVTVGTVSLVFPNDSATRAFVSWRWERGHGGGNVVYSAKQCVYAYQQDAPASASAPMAVGPSLSDAPPSETQPTSGAPQGPYYKGIWIDPSVPGYEVETDEFISNALDKCPDPNANPLPPNCVPSPPFPGTPNDPAHAMGYTQFHTLSIYDRAGKPAWLVAQMGPDPQWPVPDWNTGAYPTVVELHEATAQYVITQPCAGYGCTTREIYTVDAGHKFGRAYQASDAGVIGLKVSTPTIQWPPAAQWPPLPPNASAAGCPMDGDYHVPSGTYCRPVKKRSDNHSVQVFPPVCDVVASGGTCPVTVKWNSSLMTQVLRIDADTGQLRAHGNDGGVVARTPWGTLEDRLGADERVYYRLMVGDRKIMDASARGFASRISAPATCVIPLGETTCKIKVAWETPDVNSGSIKIYRSVSRNGAASVEDPQPFAENVSSGNKDDTVTFGDTVYYTVYRVVGTVRTWLASTSSNPTVPRRAVVTIGRSSCSVPLDQTTCPIGLTWDAGDAVGINVFRVVVGHDETCPASDPCVRVMGGASGTATDNLPLGQNAFYVVKQVGRAQPMAKSDVAGAFASELTTDRSVCSVTEPQTTCSITLSWRTLAEARIYRVDEVGSGSTDIGCVPSGCGAVATRVETLAPGARVHYELKIDGVLHAKTNTVTAITDSEGGDDGSDGTVDDPGSPASFTEPTLDVESDKVGAVAGEFRVDEGGGATYRIPLATPRGAGGLTPSLALAYNSAGADGPLGTGFSLEGASAITACRPSAEAGDNGEPTANPSEFCLDGQRLLLVKNTHRQIGAEYRTELESFQRIKLVAVENIGLSNHDATGYVFTVEAKDGSVRTFGGVGGTVSSRIAVGSASTTSQSGGSVEPAPDGQARYTAQAWLQTQLKDAVGNTVSFQYGSAAGEGQRHLERIDYSGGSVVFGYVDSPRTDLAYSALGSRWQSKLVSGIEVKAANGNTLRYYEPIYNVTPGTIYGPAWARSRPVLTSFKECSRQNGVCYPATTLAWSFASPATDEFSGLLPAKPGGYYQLGDFNGDGRTDLWWTSSPNGQANQQLHIATYTADAPSGQPTVRSTDTGMLFPNGYVNGGLWEVLDFDGDGRDDLLYAFNTQDGADNSPRNRMDWYLRRSTGTGLASKELVASTTIDWNLCLQYGLTFTAELQASGQLQGADQTNGTMKFLGSSLRADIDGDGIGDLVFRACDGRFWVALMKRTGTADKPYEFKVAEAKFQDENGAPLSGSRCGYTTASLWRKEENFTQATDFDGDGRADLKFLVDARTCFGLPGDPPFRLDVFLAKGKASDGSLIFRAARPLGPTPVISAQGITEAGQKLRTLDVNGDGLADLVYRATDGRWRYRLGGPYSAATDSPAADALVPSGVQADHRTMQLLDFDGDGKLDLWEERSGTYSMVWLWRGNNWSSTAIVNTDYRREDSNWLHAFGDFDGDGVLDSFTAKIEDPNGNHADDRAWKLRRSKAHHQPRGLLTKITNGFGAVTDIEYAPLTFSSVYRRDYNAPFVYSGRGSAVFDVATPSYVVRRVSSSAPVANDANAKSKVSYRYAGLKVQAGGRGSLGFRRVSSYDSSYAQGTTTVNTDYQQRFPYTGLAEFTETLNSSSAQDGDACGSGALATPDSPLCMKYVPPCADGLNTVCEGAVFLGSSVVVKESTDEWQFRKGGVGGAVGALQPRCVPLPGGGPDPTSEVPPLQEGEPAAAPSCPSGWRMAQPDELDQQTLSSGSAAPIFLARVHSLSNSYDLRTGIPGGTLSSESVDFSIADYDDYGNPGAGSTTKSGGNTTVSTSSKFDYGNDELDRRFGRLRTASVLTTRTTEGVTRTNVRRSSFKYDAKGLLAMEKVEGVGGASIDGPVDATAPTVATYYVYDAYGNRTKTSTCSTNISESACRTQDASGTAGYSFHPANPTDVMRHSTATYALSGGRFVDARTELFSKGMGVAQASEFSAFAFSRNDGGDPLETDDFKGIRTKDRYGALGRKRFTWTPDGASTRWDARFCTGVAVPAGTPTAPCPAGMGLVYQATTTKSGAPTGIAFYDVLGRPTVKLTQGFAPNSWSATLVLYDAHGNVKRQSDPFYVLDAGANAATKVPGETIYWTETDYDALNRPRRIQYTATGATTTIDYDGLRTVTTLPVNGSGYTQTLTEIRNGLGEVVRTIDANGSEVAMQYDAGGNVVEIRRGGVVTTMRYDTLGRKIGMSDPDAGSWTYAVNGAGETIRQVSPRGTCTTSEYDGRGRIWRRRDYGNAACTALEAESTWTYDMAGLGELAQESNGQVLRYYDYDRFGRLARLDTSIEGKSYGEEWTFDSYGRPFQHFFQPPGLPKTGEQNAYTATGYLARTESAYATAEGRVPMYRQIEAVNARGQVVKERSAPGAEYTQDRVYDGAGRLRVLLAQSQTGGLLQSLSYDYDQVGNLMNRSSSDRLPLPYEKFDYDALQRLVSGSVTVGGTTFYGRSQSYYADGNLNYKNDAGQYTYGTKPAGCTAPGEVPPGPHAVSDVGATWRCYDANGNVVRQLDNQTGQRVLGIQYDAADQAVDLVHDVNYTRVGFRYGPNRERVRRLDYANAVAPTASTIVHYVGGAEIRYAARADGGAGVLQEVRRYAGNVMVVQSGGGASYRLKRLVRLAERQGSTYQVLGAMTLRPANAASPMDFDAWGKRREAERWSEAVPWTANLESQLRTSTTHGYTGHEMAEAVGVIHMNGRLYDPHFGRFLQADPLVQSPQNLQSWNRYSYAFNNPLAYTDPSGHMSVGDALRTVAAIAIVYYAPYLAPYLGESTAAAYVVGGFAAGAVQTGSLRGAVTGAVSAGVFYGIGGALPVRGDEGTFYNASGGLTTAGYAVRTLAYGAAGGVMETLQGGRFGHGFVSAGVSAALGPTIGQIGNDAAGTLASAVAGGTASQLAGGKFANGAVTAAFSYAFGRMAAGGGSSSGSNPIGEDGLGFSGSPYYIPDFGAPLVRVAFSGSAMYGYIPEMLSATSDYYASIGLPVQFSEVPAGTSGVLTVNSGAGAPLLDPSGMKSLTNISVGFWGGYTAESIWMNTSSRNLGYVFSHEFAHASGLIDRYTNTTIHPGYEGNLMGSYGGVFLYQSQISTVRANLKDGWHPKLKTTDGKF